MSGTADMMVSPSNSKTTRSTPCVEGCCGPMFRVMRRTEPSGGWWTVASAASAVMVSVWDSVSRIGVLFFAVAVFVAVHRIILAQRVAFPIDRHQDTAQIGMITETDSE